MANETVWLDTADGLVLEGELRSANDAGAGVEQIAAAVLTHPHPAHGGSMDANVTAALFEALPRHGISALRFNFRGVGRSGGAHDGGKAERLDVVAAIDGIDAAIADPPVPVVLVGYSFGADVALAVTDARLHAWVAIAPPLRIGGPPFAAAEDRRSKLLLAAEHDQFAPPARLRAEVASWAETTVETIAMADHFFGGRTSAVASRVIEWIRAAATSAALS